MQLKIDALKERAPGRVAVETGGLTKRFRSMTALDGCTITVPRGRISALIGHNGADKVTLLRLLCGLARPSEGSVSVPGHAPGQGETGYVGGSDEDAYEHRQIPAGRQRVPHAQIFTFPGGHLTTSEHPDLLAAAIRGIAARHGVGTPATAG